MRLKIKKKSIAGLRFFAFVAINVSAQNPIIRHIRKADPSAHVWEDGKVWLYTSHDKDSSLNYNTMDRYHAFSTIDMANWTDHGEILHSRDINWGVPGFMWAPTAAYKNSKYYLIYPYSADGTREMRCGVAVSKVPQGPFKDIGWIEGVEGKLIDPCVFIDEDGTPYLYLGLDKPLVAKLKDNFTELAEEPRLVEYGSDNFFEAIYMHKYNGKYYFSYNKGEGGYSSVGDNAYGPFEYKGAVNPSQIKDHHSIIEYKGQGYFFYHVPDWNGGTVYRRNTCVEYLEYNNDGTIVSVYPTKKGVSKIEDK